MIVVSNTSPLINLAWIGCLNLLNDLFQRILIPQAVWDETVGVGQGRPGAPETAAAAWIERCQVKNTNLVLALRQDLDAGEAEAIALAVERSAALLIMDERLGRETVERFGIRPIGTIGVLVAVKRSGLIPHIRPHLDTLRSEAGFYIADTLYRHVLTDNAE